MRLLGLGMVGSWQCFPALVLEMEGFPLSKLEKKWSVGVSRDMIIRGVSVICYGCEVAVGATLHDGLLLFCGFVAG